MSVFHPTPVLCSCGRRFTASLLRSANVHRMPALRTKVLEGSFHRVVCPGCNAASNVETTFCYSDPDRETLFLVFPRNQRYHYHSHGKRLWRAAQPYFRGLLEPKKAKLRVVYGLNELREKLVAQDAGYDDRALEYLKAKLLSAHPFLTQKNRVQLFLHRHSRARVTFLAYHHHDRQIYQIDLPRPTADRAMMETSNWLAAHTGENAPAGPLAPAVRLDDFWVNFRNWTSRYNALEVLHAMAEDIRAGKNPPLDGADFTRLLQALQKLDDLPSAAKQDLNTLFDYSRAQNNESVERQLFEIRFKKQIGNEWLTNTDDTDIPVLWQVLRSLPESNVEENASLKTIDLDPGVSTGLYDPTGGKIQINPDELNYPTDFEELLRHEVGHAVNEKWRGDIDRWLVDTFGWKMYPQEGTTDDGEWSKAVNDWADAMGGWGPASPSEQSEIIKFIHACLVATPPHAAQTGDWNPVLTPPFPHGHAWTLEDCLPAKAYQKSGDGAWFTNCDQWVKSKSGEKKFAVDFYYGQLMEVNTKAIDDYVLKMARTDHYGAMSMAEFFAELYALYFDPPEQPDTIIEPEVLEWLKEHVGPMEVHNPAPPGAPST